MIVTIVTLDHPDMRSLGFKTRRQDGMFLHEPTGVTYTDEDVAEALLQYRRGISLRDIDVLQITDDKNKLIDWTDRL